MKLRILGITAGAALLGLASTNAAARTDVYVGLELGVPAPVVVERRPVYYYEYEPEPVYYYSYREYPRTTYVYHEREVRYHRHDRGHHRGHHKHRHHH